MKGIFYGWWIVVASFFIALYVAGTIFYGFTAFFEPIVEEFGWSYTEVSIGASLRGLEMGILAPLIGFLVDRFGSRKLALFGVITVGVGLILISQTQSLVMLYAGFLVLSLGAGGCTSIVLYTAVANWFKRHIGRALGIAACGFGSGGLMVPLIPLLIDTYDWRTTLVILALGIWVMGIPLALIIRDKPEQYGYLPDGGVMPISTSDYSAVPEPAQASFSDLIKGRTLWFISLAESIRWIIITAVVIHIMPYLSSVGFPRASAALVAAAVPLISLIGRFGFGWLGDIFDKRYLMAITYLLTGIAMITLSFVSEGIITFLFVIFFALAIGGSVTLRGAMLSDYFGRNSFGRALGISMGASAIGSIIGPTLAGLTFDTTGSYKLIWLIYGGLTIISITLILMLKPAGSLNAELTNSAN
ncbi:MAG: MFS transporter [Chloroflexota bacterium]|nr:MAG: MFS transporter [Chloroflexota bacterium]